MKESFSIALVLASSRPSGTDFEYPSLLKIGARSVSALIPLLEPKIESIRQLSRELSLGHYA